MSARRDRILFAAFTVYVALLVFATIGEIFDIDWILNIFDLKKLFSI
jgi:hypothetical protein